VILTLAVSISARRKAASKEKREKIVRDDFLMVSGGFLGLIFLAGGVYITIDFLKVITQSDRIDMGFVIFSAMILFLYIFGSLMVREAYRMYKG